MTEVLRKMLVAGAAVAALSVAACGQPADTAADTNTEVATDVMANDLVTNDTTVVTNDTTVVTNDTTTTTNTTAE